MRRVASLATAAVRRFRNDPRGIAAVEFAFVMPILLSLFLLGNTLSDAIACHRKVTTTARAVADLTSRFSSVSTADVQGILNASAQIMAPYDMTSGIVEVAQVQVMDATHAQVVWSQALNAAPQTNGSTVTIPANMSPVGTYLIVGTFSYPYRPVIAWEGMGAVNLTDTIIMSPRLADQVPHQ